MRRTLKKGLAGGIAAMIMCLSAGMPCTAAPDAESETLSEPAGSRIIVSLGDSYSSGEGNPPFFADAPVQSVDFIQEDWVAHRSKIAWSGQLKLDDPDGRGRIVMNEHRDTNWFFVADSGAKAYHIWNKDGNKRVKEFYHVVLDKAVDCAEALLNNIYPHYTSPALDYSYSLPQQIEVFDRLDGKQAEYVTLTIGGNDLGFADIVTAAVFQRSCGWLNTDGFEKKFNQYWSRFENSYEDDNLETGKKKTYKMPSVQKQLESLYKKLSDTAGKQAKIIVAGYPKLMKEYGEYAGIGLGSFSIPVVSTEVFPPENAVLVNQKIGEFNNWVKETAERLRGEGYPIYYADVQAAFGENHEAYTDDPYLNGIICPSKYQDLNFPSAISSYSMHPNEKGVEAYRHAVQKVINDIEGKEPFGGLKENLESLGETIGDGLDTLQEYLQSHTSSGSDESSMPDPGSHAGTERSGDESSEEEYISDPFITGTWRCTGGEGYGRTQRGKTVTFDGDYCNLCTQEDVYLFEYDDDSECWTLYTASAESDDEPWFYVEILDDNHIDLYVLDDEGYSYEVPEIRLTRVTGEDGGGSDTGAVPAGTYSAGIYGVDVMSFTFYGSNTVTMNAFGISGDGTYEIENGEIVIHYRQPMFAGDVEQIWRQPFSMSGNDIVISGVTFTRTG